MGRRDFRDKVPPPKLVGFSVAKITFVV